MAHPIQELRRLLATSTLQKRRGVVQRTEANRIYVTVNGITRSITKTDATTYRPGDAVFLLGDSLLGKAGRKRTPRTYVL